MPRSKEVEELQNLLVELGRKLGYEAEKEYVDRRSAIRYDVAWYLKLPRWWLKAKECVGEEAEAEEDLVVAAFEIEHGDVQTKYMRGDVYNVSLASFGFCIVKRNDIRRRMKKVLSEFARTHGEKRVVIMSFEEAKKWCKELLESER